MKLLHKSNSIHQIVGRNQLQTSCAVHSTIDIRQCHHTAVFLQRTLQEVGQLLCKVRGVPTPGSLLRHWVRYAHAEEVSLELGGLIVIRVNLSSAKEGRSLKIPI